MLCVSDSDSDSDRVSKVSEDMVRGSVLRGSVLRGSVLGRV